MVMVSGDYESHGRKGGRGGGRYGIGGRLSRLWYGHTNKTGIT